MSRRFESVALPAGVLLGLLAAWALVFRGQGVADFPGPARVVAAFGELVRTPPGARVPLLVGHVLASVFRVAWGFVLAALFAVPLGLLMGWHARVQRALDPLVQILRPISPIAWIPIAILLLRHDDPRSIFLIFISSFFPIVVATAAAVRNVPEVYLRSAANFGCGGFRLISAVVLPAALPQILTGLRLAAGVAWMVVVAAEMVAIESGLGYLIIDARNAGGRYDLIVAAMLTIGLIGLGLDTLMRRAERLDEVKWGYESRGA